MNYKFEDELQKNDLRNDSWLNEKSVLLLNPHRAKEENWVLRKLYEKYTSSLPNHIWLCSSGSTSSTNETVKLVALPKLGFLESARTVNAHLEGCAEDVWGLVLPRFHVGGLALYARSFLSGASLFDYFDDFVKWSPSNFLFFLKKNKVTMVSLVPTQVFDLVKTQMKAPENLRVAVVGGAALETDLYSRARALGWPLLPSFGMTETGSQIATALLTSLKENDSRIRTDFPLLKVLEHLECDVDEKSCLRVRGASLLSGFAQEINGELMFKSCKDGDGWLQTQDRVELRGGYLKSLGRESDYVKILGEGVNLNRIEENLRDFCRQRGFSSEIYLVGVADARRGTCLDVFGLEGQREEVLKGLIAEFNKLVAGIYRIQKVQFVPDFPKTELGKIKRRELLVAKG